MKKTIFLGIDQTGAVNKNGHPKPLPACLIRDDRVEFFYLKKLSKEQIILNSRITEEENILICIDCALGLPRDVDISWRHALKLTDAYLNYGRSSAEQFFKILGKGKIHRREIEIKCHANSVFQSRPFQKNIQTGTFRLWKDISADHDSFYVPALEKRRDKNQLPLFEGYPSLSWKIILKSRNRMPENLTQLLKKNSISVQWKSSHQKAINKDSNLADALVLALTLKNLHTGLKFNRLYDEGHILGAEFAHQL